MAGSRRELSSSFKPNEYYDPEVQTVKEPIRTVLEKYSKIPAEKIADHVNEVVSLQHTTTLRLYILTPGSGNVLGLWYVIYMHAPYTPRTLAKSNGFSSPILVLEASGSLTCISQLLTSMLRSLNVLNPARSSWMSVADWPKRFECWYVHQHPLSTY